MNAVSEVKLATTALKVSFVVRPIENVVCDLSGILANYTEGLLRAFYPKIVAKRANILITELVNNVLENIMDPESEFAVDVSIDGAALVIKVNNRVAPERYEKVKNHVDKINDSGGPKRLLKQVVRERRRNRTVGGLGLIRVAAENKFRLSTSYREGTLCVESVLDLGGLP